MRQRNIQQLIHYFESGVKQCDSVFYMGLELEHFVVDAQERPVSYSGEHGIGQLLKKMAPLYAEKRYSGDHLVGLSRKDADISIEPAGQLEISISPQCDPGEVLRIYKQFYDECNSILSEWGYHLLERGYLVKGKAAQQELIPKKRYEFMDKYFSKIGSDGCCMMRGTAATQVSIDYSSEADCMRKYWASYCLWPFLECLAANTPIYEDAINDNPLQRSRIWQNVDAKRTDFPVSEDLGQMNFASYAKFVYEVPLIVANIGGDECYVEQSAEYLYANTLMTDREIEHVLSMVFPPVRLKKFIEIRYADSLPIKEAIGYMLLLKGLLSDPVPVLEWLSKMQIRSQKDVEEIVEEIYRSGMQATVRGRKLGEILQELIDMAKQCLTQSEKEYLVPFIERGMNNGYKRQNANECFSRVL